MNVVTFFGFFSQLSDFRVWYWNTEVRTALFCRCSSWVQITKGKSSLKAKSLRSFILFMVCVMWVYVRLNAWILFELISVKRERGKPHLHAYSCIWLCQILQMDWVLVETQIYALGCPRLKISGLVFNPLIFVTVKEWVYDGSQHLDLVNWQISHQWLYMIVHVVVLYMFYHWKTMKVKTQESCDLYIYHWKLPVNTGTETSCLLRKSLGPGPAPSLTRFYKYRITQPRSWPCQWETWMRVGW